MSYPKDMEEYTDDELKTELYFRKLKREEGVCDYCNRKADSKPCRFPDRHSLAKGNDNGQQTTSR